MSKPDKSDPGELLAKGQEKRTRKKAKPIPRKDKRPILRGFRVGRMVYVHCPWCDRLHTHGWELEDNASVITVRVAHGAHSNLGHGAPDHYWISVFRENDLKWIERDQEEARREEMLRKHHEARGGQNESNRTL